MFDKKPFENVDPNTANTIMYEAQKNLTDKLFKNNTWNVDYVRIRMKAVKI